SRATATLSARAGGYAVRPRSPLLRSSTGALEDRHQPVGERHARELGVVAELRGAYVGGRCERAADRASEIVEDDEVKIIAHALDAACQRPDLDDEPGLLADLARDRLRERLAALEPAARHRPQAFARRLAALDHEHALSLVEH